MVKRKMLLPLFQIRDRGPRNSDLRSKFFLRHLKHFAGMLNRPSNMPI
jgi:hypothetical protein